MGFSERTGTFRRLADRINDLGDLTAALGLDGPVVTVGHDWGGVISLGWAVAHPQQLAGVVLTNTAVHQPAGTPRPAGAAARPAPCRAPLGNDDVGCLPARDPRPGPSAARRGRPAGLHGPLPRRRPPRRRGALCRGHSRRRVPSQLPGADPRRRRAARAEDAGPDALGPAGSDLFRPVPQGPHRPAAARESPPLRGCRPPGRGRPGHRRARLRVACRVRPANGDGLQRTAAPAGRQRRRRTRRWTTGPVPWSPAPGPRPSGRPSTELAAGPARRGYRRRGNGAGRQRRPLAQLAELEQNIAALAGGTAATPVCGTGSRVSLMVPPGVDLTVVLYACLRLGAVVVVADAGLGTRGLSRAVQGATPDFLIGIDKALAAAAALGWPGRRISVRDLPAARRRLLAVETSLAALRRRRGAGRSPAPPCPPVPAGRTPPPPCSSPPAPPAPPRACSTRTGSWPRCGTPWPQPWGSARAHAWWRASRRSPCWARRSEPSR